MKRSILLALVLVATVCGAGEYSNRRAPGFSLYDSHLVQHDPQDYRGKLVLVDFMLTTCPVCQKLADVLVKVKANYGDRIAIMSVMTGPRAALLTSPLPNPVSQTDVPPSRRLCRRVQNYLANVARFRPGHDVLHEVDAVKSADALSASVSD